MDFDGTHTFTGVAPGAHTVSAFLVTDTHTKISGTDASVSFETQAVPKEPKILVYHEVLSETQGGFFHNSIPAGIAAIQQLGIDNGFLVDDSADSAVFTDANLAQYDAVVFLSTHSVPSQGIIEAPGRRGSRTPPAPALFSLRRPCIRPCR